MAGLGPGEGCSRAESNIDALMGSELSASLEQLRGLC